MVTRVFFRATAAFVIAASAGYSALAMHEALRPLDIGATLVRCGPAAPCLVTGVSERGASAGLQPRDRLLRVDGLAAWRDIADSRATAFFSSRAGIAQTLWVERAGRQLPATVVPVRVAPRQRPLEAAAEWTARWIAIVVGALLLWRRPSAVGWLAGLMLLGAGLGASYPIHAPGVAGAARAFGTVAGGAMLITASSAHAAAGLCFPWLWLMFPAWPAALAGRRRAAALILASALWLPFAVTEVLLTAAVWTGADLPVPAPLRHTIIAAAAVIVTGAAAMIYNFRTAASLDARARLRPILAMLVLLAALWTARAMAARSGSNAVQEAASAGVRLSIAVLPLVIGWAVLRHRAFGMRIYLRGSIRAALARSTLSVLLVAPSLLLAFVAGRLGADAAKRYWWLVALAAAGALLGLFRRSILRWIDRRLFLENSTSQRLLLALSNDLRQAGTLEEIEACVRQAIESAFRPRRLEVACFDDPDAAVAAARRAATRFTAAEPPMPTAEALAASGPVQLSGHREAAFAEEEAWLIPIVEAGRRVRGYIVTGGRASNEPYGEEDLTFLAAIAQAAAVQALAAELARNLVRERAARVELAESYERERERLTRELHDGVGSTLVRIALLADSRAEDAAAGAGELARSGMIELRQMLWVTDAASADLRETVPYLRRLTLESAAAAGLPATFDVAGIAPAEERVDTHGAGSPSPVILRPAQRLALLRTLQQALTNVVTHASASEVRVTLEQIPGLLRLIVQDDGRGFDPGSAPGRRSGHYGLASLAQRAREVDGRFVIHTAPGRGTRGILELPTDDRPLQPAGAAPAAEEQVVSWDENGRVRVSHAS